MRLEDVEEVEFDGETTQYFREVERFDPDKCDIHEVTKGEKLEHLAYQYYNDVSLWYLIADANPKIAQNPMASLQGGERILIPKA